MRPWCLALLLLAPLAAAARVEDPEITHLLEFVRAALAPLSATISAITPATLPITWPAERRVSAAALQTPAAPAMVAVLEATPESRQNTAAGSQGVA